MVNFVHFRNTKYTNYHAPWERPIWPPRVKCDCDQASIFARPQGGMRYLVYMRYLWCGAFNLRLIKLLKKSKLKEIKQIWCHNISKYILRLSMVISLKNTVCLNIFWIFNIASTWHHLVSIATNCAADLQVFTELLDFYKLYAIQVFLSGLHKICSITLKSWYFVV